MDALVKTYDGGEVLYLAVDPNGQWERSEFPTPLTTVDYDASGRVIGVEAIGPTAQKAIQQLIDTLLPEPAEQGLHDDVSVAVTS